MRIAMTQKKIRWAGQPKHVLDLATGLRKRGHEVRVFKFPFTAIAKAAILGDTDGFVKIVGDKKYDELLGVHVIGPRATELIGEAGTALRLESTVEELFHAVHAHPTLSEAVGEAALGTHGRSIHI